MRRACLLLFALLLSMFLPRAAAAAGQEIRQAEFITAIDRMMLALAPQSAHASATIRGEYRHHLDLLFLNAYRDLEGALATGGLAPLPADPHLYNVRPRLEGEHPIGEKDLRNQDTYLAARPATIGCLLAVAARVRSGSVEITSLVRHGGYQEALRGTNPNATTSVPMHAMGLAFDIALVNTPIETVYEIRNVLRQMRDAGDLLFIGERQQLVFHVVPHPSRLGYFNDVYMNALGAPRADRAVQVVAPAPPGLVPSLTDRPRVVTEILAFVAAGPSVIPAAMPARAVPATAVRATAALSRAALSRAVLSRAVPVRAVPGAAAPAEAPLASPARGAFRASAFAQVWLVMLTGMLATACRVTAPCPAMAPLFRRTIPRSVAGS